MPVSVKVIGAGSIGNHLAHGCRSLGWKVTLVDLDHQALARTREVIYPSRYGAWDDKIVLAAPQEVLGEHFDLVIVGTPPATHLSIAMEELKSTSPSLLLIEKPLSHPDQDAINSFVAVAASSATRVLVGYNQRLKPNTLKFIEVAGSLDLGELKGLSSEMLESWDGIMKAHFWMSSEKDSYLAFSNQGGGALLEHSHALNLFLYLAAQLDQGRAEEVSASIEWVKHESGEYDRDSVLRITLGSGLIGEVRQDLHTWPASKKARADFERGALVWRMGESSDALDYFSPEGELLDQWDFPKTRPDDFLGELRHLGSLLEEPNQGSPLDLEHGVEVMRVALAAFESSRSLAPQKIPRD